MADAAAEGAACVPVTVCLALGSGHAEEFAAEAPAGARIADVLALPRVRGALSAADADPQALDVGIWGRRLPATHRVRPGDRVEVYRPLRVDPMTARRERFRKQGARATGLFAAPLRAGGKAGY
ncbi:MAG: RnfH family protein [Xylophilus ampelinus]